MKHLYSLVFVLIALTSSHLSSAQIVYALPASSPSTCDGSVHFYDHANYDQPDWTWTWYEDSTTIIATGDSVVSNLCAGLYSLTLDSAGNSITVYVTVTDPCSNFSLSMNNNQTTPGNCLAHISASPSGGAYPYSFSWSNGATTSYQYGVCAGVYNVTCVDANGCSLSGSVTVTDSVPPPNPCSSFALNVTITDCTPGNCDGSVTFIPIGGSGPYIYSLSGGPQSPVSPITNLCAGSYSAYCTDANGCIVSTPLIVTDPCTNLAVSANTTNANTGFNNGGIQATATGGNPPYTYSISGGPFQPIGTFTNLFSGTYTIDCYDAIGCMSSLNVTVIDDPIVPHLTISNDSTGSCVGSASVSPTGGIAPYTYQWSNGATTNSIANLCAGNYSVLITDALLDTVSSIFTIAGPNPCTNIAISTLVTNATNSASCDGIIQITASGGTPSYLYAVDGGLTFFAANTFNTLCPGSYTVVVMDLNGCSSSQLVSLSDSVTVNLAANLTSTNALSGNCSGSASVSPTGGVGPYSYLWSNGATTSSISNLCVGAYSVTIWDANGDSITSGFNITNPCAGLSFTVSTTQSIPGNCIGIISVTPNFSFSGYSWSNGSNSLTIYNLCAGTYTITCAATNGCSVSESITIADSLPGSPFNADLSFTDDLASNCSGSATILPTGGFSPYSYYWSTGETTSSIDNLCAGIYSAVAWDATNIDSLYFSFVINDSSTTYGNNPYPNGTINDTLYTDLVTNCMIDYTDIDSASLYQAVYNSSNQSLYVTWAVYSPTDTVYINDTLALIGNPGYYALTISVYCPNKSGNDFMKIDGVIYFDGTNVYFSTLGLVENPFENVSVYPNPFTSSISVDNKDGLIRSMKLIDLNGRILSEMSYVQSGVVEMNTLETLSSGTYLLVLSGESSLKTVKVIK